MDYTISKILVPVDLSGTSLSALDIAIALAKKNGASLQILNVIEPKYLLSHAYRTVAGDNFASSPDLLSSLVDVVKHTHEIKPQLIQTQGIVYDQVLKIAYARNCNLIVMGSNGASGLRNGFLGSNTYNVMKYANCPVLTIPPETKFSGFKKILYPVRPVSGAQQQYRILCHFLSADTVIEVLGIFYRQSEKETNLLSKITDEIRKDTNRDQVKIETVWAEGNSISENVLQYAMMNIPDLIVLNDILEASAQSLEVGTSIQNIDNRSKFPILRIKGIRLFAVA